MTQSSMEQIRIVLEKLSNGFRTGERYQALGALGQGGFGEVERCFDHQLNRPVARKTLRAVDGYWEPERVNLLLSEARLISYIDHPGVVPIYEFELSEEGKLSYTMKALEGLTLREMLMSYDLWVEPLPLSQALQIFTKLCETMACAHEKGVLHLDLKPENIMIGQFGEVMVLDWGSARLFAPERYESFLKASGIPLQGNEIRDSVAGGVGTVPYMPLEQITHPRHELTPAADIFSVGVLLYFMLAGTFPFQASNRRDYAVELHSPPLPLQDIRDELPLQLSEICNKMLLPNPKERYQSFLELLDELQELINAGQRFQVKTFAPGETLVREGEEGNFVLHIVEGEVEISVEVDGTKQVLATCTKGEMIGELAIFSNQPRLATATALTPTRTRVMPRDDIESELDKLPPWISLMIRGLSNKFIERQTRRVHGKA